MKETDERPWGTLSTVAINSNNSEYPPSDSYENLLDWAKDNLQSDFYTILNSTIVCSPLISYNLQNDYRKCVEVLGEKWPRNFILLGDALCTVNPQFSQGMTHFLQCAGTSGQFSTEFQYIMNRCSSPFQLLNPLTVLIVFYLALMNYLGFSEK
ncbi:unnamed protein product [Adineta ricciae]|nr:unnamed protein product [Adineta ricciae]